MTLVADNLPKTSDTIPVLSYFLMLLIVMSTLISFTTVLNLRLYFKTGTVPNYVQSCVQNLHCYLCRFKKKANTKANKVQPSDAGDITDTTDNCSDVSVTNKPEISWKDVCDVLDMFFALFFFLATVILSLTFLLFLSTA